MCVCVNWVSLIFCVMDVWIPTCYVSCMPLFDTIIGVSRIFWRFHLRRRCSTVVHILIIYCSLLPTTTLLLTELDLIAWLSIELNAPITTWLVSSRTNLRGSGARLWWLLLGHARGVLEIYECALLIRCPCSLATIACPIFFPLPEIPAMQYSSFMRSHHAMLAPTMYLYRGS